LGLLFSVCSPQQANPPCCPFLEAYKFAAGKRRPAPRRRSGEQSSQCRPAMVHLAPPFSPPFSPFRARSGDRRRHPTLLRGRTVGIGSQDPDVVVTDRSLLVSGSPRCLFSPVPHTPHSINGSGHFSWWQLVRGYHCNLCEVRPSATLQLRDVSFGKTRFYAVPPAVMAIFPFAH
jgi:hypothetical protein